MHVPHGVTTPLVLLASVLLLALTSGSRGGWGQVGRGAGTASVDDPSGPGPHSPEGAEDASGLCDDARLQCTMRMGCQMALNNFFTGCRSLLLGEEVLCSTACQHALVSLLTTEDGTGLAFMHCNCSGQEVCEERKRRVQVCQRHVLRSMSLVRDRDATLGCTLARWICEADTSCLAALQYYVQHCSQLFTGTRCTARCRNSMHILYRQPNAHKLRTCRCEGDEDYDCPSVVNNTERLCLQRHRHHHHHQHRNLSQHHHGYVDENGEGGYRQPGRQPAVSITQLHTSGQTSGPEAGSSGAVTVPVALCVLVSVCVALLPPACL